MMNTSGRQYADTLANGAVFKPLGFLLARFAPLADCDMPDCVVRGCTVESVRRLIRWRRASCRSTGPARPLVRHSGWPMTSDESRCSAMSMPRCADEDIEAALEQFRLIAGDLAAPQDGEGP